MTEQINKIAIIDETLNFISPEIIAEAGSPDRVLPVLKLAQLALSVFHPDRNQLETSDLYHDRGEQALTKVNSIVKSFEDDEQLAEFFYSTSCEIVDNSGQKIRTELGLLDSTLNIREQITVKQDQLTGNNQIERTGEVIKHTASQKLLALLFGRSVISLLENTDKENLSGIMPLLKKKFLKETDSPFGISNIEWIAVFDEIQETGQIDGTQVANSDVNNITSDDILETISNKRFQAFGTLLELLKPNEKLNYPEEWYRSFSGKIVCPTSRREWPRYEDFTALNHDVELRVFDVYDVEDGIVKSSARLDASSRDSIKLINDIEDTGQKKWVKQLINHVAGTIGYEANKFTIKTKENGGNEPMDFMFEVTEDQKINILYTRPRSENAANANKESISFEEIGFAKNSNPLESGFYMIKAGKNSKTKKYNASPPLALISLIPEYNDQFIGTAFIGGHSNLFSGETVNLSYTSKLDAEPNPNELPALLGSKIGFEKDRLFNIHNLFTGLNREQDYTKIRKIFEREFVNTGNNLYHLTFIDNGDFLESDDNSVVSDKAPGRVYSQTSLSGHLARLIKSK